MAVLKRQNSQPSEIHARARRARLPRDLTARSTIAPTEVSVGVEAAPSTSTAAAPNHRHDRLSAAEKGITAAIVIVAVLILGLLAWKIGKWRRQKSRAASNSINISLMAKKQGGKAIHIDFDSDGRVMEKPTMHVALPAVPPASAKQTSMSASKPWMHVLASALPTFPGSTTRPRDERDERSPPPSYSVFANGAASPPSSHRVQPPSLDIPTKHDSARVVVPSPRSASYGVDSPLYKAPLLTGVRPKSLLVSKPLPRVMVVQNTFKPSLPDELLIMIGEKLKLLEEYEDEWCLVEREGSKGVVPRFCLSEQA
ncbi:uncharacterized protein LAESUDRAFT_669725 [Laetiporus sulphureus 93-53]|uniref:SH3 domain-containing protein n=1 Tax=Laetiporus sulphureus 93-53 TaxID=1314785 RepID=A0A165IM09_9APHY|nr:uncharacterized protein LAESUDRAFT_669725 [Laetiporus sulphureus 93-53]KZT13265.1 hypothetical protein LAESUDRAFT_669725 [Laetiporus sulphureus 93-53]